MSREASCAHPSPATSPSRMFAFRIRSAQMRLFSRTFQWSSQMESVWPSSELRGLESLPSLHCFNVSTGSISIGANDIHGTDVTHLREHVAVVSQNPNLFDASISENIAYGNTTLSASDIRRAAKAANVHDFIMLLFWRRSATPRWAVPLSW